MESVGPSRLHEGMPEGCPYCGAKGGADKDRAPCRHLAWFETVDTWPKAPNALASPRWDENSVRQTIRMLAGLPPSIPQWVTKPAAGYEGFDPSLSAVSRFMPPRVRVVSQGWRGLLSRLSAWFGLTWDRWWFK